MPIRMDRESPPTELRDETADSSPRVSTPRSVGSSPYRPSSRFRQALNRDARYQVSPKETLTATAAMSSRARQDPELLALLGAAPAVGVAAGFLELAVLMIQVHWPAPGRLSTLRISRHVAWMVPVAETLVTVVLTLRWWRRRWPGRPVREGGGGRRRARLLDLGLGGIGPGDAAVPRPAPGGPSPAPSRRPCVRRAVPASRSAAWFVPAPPGWRALLLGGAIALADARRPTRTVQWDRVAHAEERAWSRPALTRPEPALDRHGHRPRRPHEPVRVRAADDARARGLGRGGITFDMARSAAPWTLPSHLTMFTGLWPFEHGARIDRPYPGPPPRWPSTSPPTATPPPARGQHGDVQRRLRRGARVRLLRRLALQPRGEPAGDDAQLDAGTVRHEAGAIGSGCRSPPTFPLKASAASHRRSSAMPRSGWAASADRNEAEAPGSRRPFFLFLNFMDVHGPYLPSADSTRQFWTEPGPSATAGRPRGRLARCRRGTPRRPIGSRDRQQELDAVTRRLRRPLRRLPARPGRRARPLPRELRAGGLLENTWVVITSDHGEQFGEHGIFGHGAEPLQPGDPRPADPHPAAGLRGDGADSDAALRGRRVDVPVSQRDLPGR